MAALSISGVSIVLNRYEARNFHPRLGAVPGQPLPGLSNWAALFQSLPLPIPAADLVSARGATSSHCNDMNQPRMKTAVPLGMAMLAVFTSSCSKEDLSKDLRLTNDELRQENMELRGKVALIDKQLAQLTERFDAVQRANQAGNQNTIANQIALAAEAKKSSAADVALRADQIKQHAVALVKKIAAQMDRLLEEIPSLENSQLAWDLSMPKFATLNKDVALQMNSLVAELEGLRFERSGDIKLKTEAFSNGYQSLPGIGRLVVSSREQAAALRAAANPSESDLQSAEGAEATMAAQLSVFNGTIIECKRIKVEVSKLGD